MPRDRTLPTMLSLFHITLLSCWNADAKDLHSRNTDTSRQSQNEYIHIYHKLNMAELNDGNGIVILTDILGGEGVRPSEYHFSKSTTGLRNTLYEEVTS